MTRTPETGAPSPLSKVMPNGSINTSTGELAISDPFSRDVDSWSVSPGRNESWQSFFTGAGGTAAVRTIPTKYPLFTALSRSIKVSASPPGVVIGGPTPQPFNRSHP